MALLSTFRPLPQHLLERLWLLLSGTVPASIEYPMTINALNDDCLLILMDTLSMSQLFLLRGVSRRLCHLIERHSLRQFKTIIFIDEEKRKKEVTGEGSIQKYCASRHDAVKEFGLQTLFFEYVDDKTFSHFPASKHVILRSNAWPLSLPHLLPRLSSLTLTHSLAVKGESSTKGRGVTVDPFFMPYLTSNWSTTLTTLHLSIHVPPRPQPDSASFAQLNQLINLKYLSLIFSRIPELELEGSPTLLPDSMPVFGQLLSFSLRYYAGSNTATLLHQLSHHLSFLSLNEVACSEDDYVTFLRARPNYVRTLKTFFVCLKNMSWKLFTVVTQSLTSLEVFDYCAHVRPKTQLPSILTDLSHLPNLQYIHLVPLFVDQLRALLLRQHLHGTLPRQTSIRQATIAIYSRSGDNGNLLQTEELFDQLLPLVSRVFCRLEKLSIHLSRRPGARLAEGLSCEQFSTRVLPLFPGLKECNTTYLVK